MKIKCLKIEQSIGVFYLAVVSSKVLEKVCYSKAAKFEAGDIVGGQRDPNSKSLSEISDFVQTENAAIPNSIILAANYTEEDEFVTEPEEMWTIEGDNGNIFINIPDPNLKICSVVDGQHRLRGIVESGLDMELPCSIFIDLPPSLQALVFATINFNQRPVDKSLAYQLFGYQLDDSKSSLWTPDILAVQLSRKFSSEGPFKGRIRLIKSKSLKNKSGWSISSAAFIGGVSSLISSNLNKDKYAINRRIVLGVAGRKALDANERLPLRQYYIQANDKAIQLVLERYFTAAKQYLWDGRDDADIVFKTVGVAAQFKFLKYLLQEDDGWKSDELYFDEKMKAIEGLDFTDEYFQPRSATTARLVNVFKLKLKMVSGDGMDPEIFAACGVPYQK